MNRPFSVTVEDESEAYGEKRLQSLGWFQGRVVFLVWKQSATTVVGGVRAGGWKLPVNRYLIGMKLEV